MNEGLKFYRKATSIFIGEENAFSLEHRIFNLFSFFVCLTTISSSILNLIFGLYESALLTTSVFILQSVILYLSRIKNKFNLAVILTGIELHVLLVTNYFFNGGIAGPTTILFSAILFLMTSVVDKKSVWFWLILNLSVVAGLFCIENLNPSFILVGYESRFFVFADVYASYVMVIILMATGILYKRIAYEKQRRVLEIKALTLEKRNTEKNKLFSIISHDLRAPVGAVKQYLKFLNEHDLSLEEKNIIEKGLLKTSTEAYELLDNLLIWTRSQMDGTKTELVSLNASEALKFTILQAKEMAKEKEVEIVEEIADLQVIADKDMLQLVVRNLISNAIKFTNFGGRIDVKVFSRNHQVIFEITDKGVGISESAKQHIFSLDIKSTAGTKKEKGTGLGLVLCKEYTLLQNGTIWFESITGKGTSFFVALPIA